MIFGFRLHPLAAAIVISLSTIASLHAAFEAKLPIPKIYSTSKAVILGTITKVNAETGAVDVKATEVLNGEGFTGPYRVTVKMEDVRKNLAEGQPVVLMPSSLKPTLVTLHLGDAWVLGDVQQGSRLPFYVVAGTHVEFNHTYPGRTTAVVAMLQELKKNGKSGLLDKADPQVLTGGVKDLGALAGIANATAVTAGDFDGDKKLDLAVATKDSVKVFTYDGKSFVAGKVAAPAGFPAELPKPAKGADNDATDPALAAVAGADFTDANGPARLVVRRAGIFREPPAGDGQQQQPKAPIDDFKRLTGDPVITYPLGFDKGVQSAASTAIDINGDGKKDVVILTETSGLVMVNRGYGAFFVIPNLPKLIAGEGKLPFGTGHGTLLAAGDVDGDGREDLIVVNAEGRVWAVLNPAAK